MCGRLLHDAAGERGGVLDVLHARDRAAGERAAVHDAGVEGEPAEAVRQAAEADGGADGVVVLDGLRPGEGGVEGRVALGEGLEGGLGGELAERPGGDDDGFGHRSGQVFECFESAASRTNRIITNHQTLKH